MDIAGIHYTHTPTETYSFAHLHSLNVFKFVGLSMPCAHTGLKLAKLAFPNNRWYYHDITEERMVFRFLIKKLHIAANKISTSKFANSIVDFNEHEKYLNGVWISKRVVAGAYMESPS